MNSLQPANKVTEENFAKLKAKLRELFQLGRGDLDFGLYRIMAFKSREVGDFLDEHLLPQIKEALGDIAKSDTTTLKERLRKIENNLQEVGVNPDDAPGVEKIRAQIRAAKSDQQTEADTYNHLYNFFARYYDEGDFMSLRRYKSTGKEAYSIPYNGEEVKLHWANVDQYYIKTTENYSSYIFIVGGDKKRRVRFEIATADNEKDNIKETNGNKRFFVLSKEFIAEDKNELIIRFDHRPLTEGEKKQYPQNGVKRQHAINQDTEQRICKKIKGEWLNLLSAPCPTEANDARTVFGKHITAYTAKNSFDYFIHKNLGSFLRRELDNYLKSEVLKIDNLQLTDDPTFFIRSLAQLKAIKIVGEKIITFLAQLENFQKQLWLKKKFVLETQYCVTLDKVPQSFYSEIAKNKAQQAEWVKLFAIGEINGDLVETAYSNPLKPKFLKENPYLVLDTRHFNQAFTDKLLAALSEAGTIEEQMNGLLVHGENFQALNLLQERYREQVQCVYIDPPYNTDASAIMYKNGYKHSSWLSLMQNRLLIAKQILCSEEGILCCTIDDVEQKILSQLVESMFGEIAGTVSIRIKPSGRPIPTGFALSHEYAIFARSNLSGAIKRLAHSDKQTARYGENDQKGSFFWERFRKAGSNSSRENRPTMFYPFFVNTKTDVVRLVEMEYDKTTDAYTLLEQPADSEIQVFPIKEDGTDGCWYFGYERAKKIANEFKAVSNGDGYKIYYRRRPNAGVQPTTHWADAKYSATEHGTALLKSLFGEQEVFSYPKSIHAVTDCLNVSGASDGDEVTVLDYFAGSGTTGHAVVNLNREDGGNRKYILVEIGHHFENVLLPRMKKVIYSKEWKDGKPQNREGISQLFKYVRLESYEDTLDSLTITSKNDLVAQAENKQFTEDYQLRYALGEETVENASLVGKDFIDPFNYTLSVVRDGVRSDVKADLVETFNFLLGLQLSSRRKIDDVLTITGITPQGENCLILWRNLKKTNISKLDKWFTKHRKNFGDDLTRIYINGDHTLNALKKPSDKWEAVTTESVFRELMFERTES